MFALGQTSRLNKQLNRGWPKLFCWSSVVVCMSRWVESNSWPYGVNALRCFGQEGIINYHWSTFLGSSLVVNLLLQVLLIFLQENKWNAKLQRIPFVFAIFIQKLPKRTGMQHQFVSKMDLEPVRSENTTIKQWCSLKPSFVPWLYQTFMIIQDKEQPMFLYCSDKEL